MARSLLDKVRALQASVSSAASTQPAAMEGLLECDKQSLSTGENSRVPYDADLQGMPERKDAQLMAAGFAAIPTPFGHCWCRTTSFDVWTRHGDARFGDFVEMDGPGLGKLLGRDIEIDRVLFYDTETNGLGTGAGTLPFLHSIGYFEGDEFHVAQYFVDDYDAEAAVLYAMDARHFTYDGTTLVSFNGKSFDWPLLQNRRVLRQMDKLDVHHLDLLHPSRRLWKHQMPSVKLSELERAILQVQRQDDLPGSEAPRRYFEYLAEGSFSVMEDVFQHNLLDVCSLVTLAVKIGYLIDGVLRPTKGGTQLALATWFDAWHDIQAAGDAYREALAFEDMNWRSHWLYSLFLKRHGETEQAIMIWKAMGDEYPSQPEPFIELAKYFEHRAHNLAAAEEMIRRALECVDASSPLADALRYRQARVQRKRARLNE